MVAKDLQQNISLEVRKACKIPTHCDRFKKKAAVVLATRAAMAAPVDILIVIAQCFCYKMPPNEVTSKCSRHQGGESNSGVGIKASAALEEIAL